jgi:threonine/homoserine/homoserine lactone efflux protein
LISLLTNILTGVITGFIVSIPPMGPIAFAIISRGFKNEIKEGKAIAIGAAFMDFFYCLLAFGGITLIVSFFPAVASDFYANNAYTIEIVLTFLGCVIVILYGLKIMRSKITYSNLEEKETVKLNSALSKVKKLEEKAEIVAKHLKVPEINKSNYLGLFFMGVLLCMSSLTIPASWVALVSYLKGYNFMNSSFFGGLIFAIGAFAGTYAWFFILLKLITGNKKRINQTTVNKLNIIAGVILLILGIFLFIKATVSVFYI